MPPTTYLPPLLAGIIFGLILILGLIGLLISYMRNTRIERDLEKNRNLPEGGVGALAPAPEMHLGGVRGGRGKVGGVGERGGMEGGIGVGGARGKGTRGEGGEDEFEDVELGPPLRDAGNGSGGGKSRKGNSFLSRISTISLRGK